MLCRLNETSVRPDRQFTLTIRRDHHGCSKWCAVIALALVRLAADAQQTAITRFARFTGNINFVATGGSLRTQSNTGDACAVGTSSTQALTRNSRRRFDRRRVFVLGRLRRRRRCERHVERPRRRGAAHVHRDVQQRRHELPVFRRLRRRHGAHHRQRHADVLGAHGDDRRAALRQQRGAPRAGA